jgi:hypothetical protein
MRCPASALAIALASLPATGHAQGYFFRQYTIFGLTNVTVTGVNDAGIAVGTYVYPIGSLVYNPGFSGKLGHAANLPMTGPVGATDITNVPHPTGINDDNTIVGVYYNDSDVNGFTFRDNAYISLDDGSAYHLPQDLIPYIGSADHIAYASWTGDAFASFAGKPGQEVPVTAPNAGLFTYVQSVNNSFHIAGSFMGILRDNLTPVVFFGTVSHLRQIAPPGATYSYGGYVNDANQVAGAYADKAGKVHGFVYDQKTYTSFDMPTQPMTALTIQGIDSKGRVVGAYSDNKRQHGFVYAAGHVTLLGTFPTTDQLGLSISYFGRYISLCDTAPGGVARSWLASVKPGTLILPTNKKHE